MADSRTASARRSWAVIAVLLAGMAFGLFTQRPVRAVYPVADRSGIDKRAKFRFKPVERCFMKKINQRRVDRGLHRLWWDRQIAYVARRHAQRMARRERVWHDHKLGRLITNWRSLGQNTGGGYECGPLFRRFWRSAGHRRNILGRWRFLGVGATRRGNRLYVQQVFEYRSNPGNVFGYP